jgi:hypothetical protein
MPEGVPAVDFFSGHFVGAPTDDDHLFQLMATTLSN